MAVSLQKHVYSIVPTVFYNLTEVPPPEMYEILMKSEEKEVCYHNKPLELPDDILFVFVAKNLGHIPDQIRKLVRWPRNFGGKFGHRFWSRTQEMET